MQTLQVAQSLHQGEISMALGSRDCWSSKKKSSFYIATQVIWRVSLDSISIKQQQMGDVSHQ